MWNLALDFNNSLTCAYWSLCYVIMRNLRNAQQHTRVEVTYFRQACILLVIHEREKRLQAQMDQAQTHVLAYLLA